MEEMTATPQSGTSVLYHYTDADGLIGIVSKRTLWCSNIVYLNDSKEWHYGVDLFFEMLDDAAKAPVGLVNAKWAPAISQTYRRYIDAQNRAAQPVNRPAQCFAMAFSKADPATSLSQWRAYSKAGSRFAVGFHCDRLRQFAEANQMTLESVEYDRQVAKADMANALASKLDQIGEKGLHAAENSFLEFGNQICVGIGTKCKHDAFLPESEVRLRRLGAPPDVDEKTPSTKFRRGAAFLVPYIELAIPLDLIHSVWIGPTDHRELAKSSVYELLSVHKLHAATVCVTEIPYRESR
jgi:hypothetical protein